MDLYYTELGHEFQNLNSSLVIFGFSVDKNKDRKWPLFGWFFAKSPKASAAAQMIGNVGAMREAWHTQFENGEEEQ